MKKIKKPLIAFVVSILVLFAVLIGGEYAGTEIEKGTVVSVQLILNSILIGASVVSAGSISLVFGIALAEYAD